MFEMSSTSAYNIHPFGQTHANAKPLTRSRVEFVMSTLEMAVSEGEQLGSMAWKVCDVVGDGLGFEDFSVFALNEEKKCLEQIAVCGIKRLGGNKVLSPMRIPLGLGVCGYVALTAKGMIVNDVVQEPLYMKDDRLRMSEICVPVLVGDKVVAVLDSESSTKGHFNMMHFELMDRIAALLARTIDELRNV
jgi:GAF domain-containing protein